MYFEALSQFGLSKKEIDVYVSLLKSGPSTPLKISTSVNIKRPTVYLIIETLKKHGLIEVKMMGLKSLFVATDPSRFEDILRDRRERLEEALPELRSFYKLKGNKSVIKYFEGVDGVKVAYENSLRDIRNGDKYYVLADTPNWRQLDYEWLEKYSERRSRRKLDIKVLLKDSKEARHFKMRERALNMHVKIFTKPLELVGDILISPQMLILHNFAPPVTATVIELDDVIQTHLNLFEYVWETVPEGE